MDNLYNMLRAISPEIKSSRDHLSVFREFLAHLDQLQRQPPPKPRSKPPLRRKTPRRVKV